MRSLKYKDNQRKVRKFSDWRFKNVGESVVREWTYISTQLLLERKKQKELEYTLLRKETPDHCTTVPKAHSLSTWNRSNV
jgi:hypothetical protein